MKKLNDITLLQPKFAVALTLMASMSCAVLTTSAHAAVYKKVDADGNVSFSDVPDKTAQVVNVAPLSTIPAMSPDLIQKTLSSSDTATTGAVNTGPYVLTILSPTPDQSFNRAEDAFAANVQVKPALREGDKIVLLVDGKPAGAKKDAANGPLIHTADLDRGSHQLEARIVSAQGKVLTSKSVSFNVQQSHR